MESKTYHHTKLSPTHEVIINMLGPGMRVLEVGCSTGYMTHALKERGCKVVAAEVDPVQAEQAEPYAERLIVGDVTRIEIRDMITERFDAVIYADVLEHFVDPWETLRWTRGKLAGGGVVLASLPNIAYRQVRAQLLIGNFDYTEYGILDDSHLRFFTEKTVRALFDSTGYTICELVRMYRGRTDRILGPLLQNAFTYQFVIKAMPHELAAGTDES